ncbi:hypothetical protein M231_07031 [Tremella mesenterica]|uniref:WSC domain-containing protein n=1 Tax=Tremella mesenterica TaxID=5217 RepID=A0A4Q1BG15_TREME|nr:hypothetical protein M231_07031 [Tremella mesenterica]
MIPLTKLGLVVTAALALNAESKPLAPPGHHAAPGVANLLAGSKRGIHALIARYYGTSHGLAKPPPLPNKRDTSFPPGWSYLACVDESWDERLLQGFSFSSSVLTPLQCMTECGKRNFTYAGTEYGDECYCGNEFIGSGGIPGEDSACNLPCWGDKDETCGNAWFLTLYQYNSSGLVTTCTTYPSSGSDSNSTTISDPTGITNTSSNSSITSTPTSIFTTATTTSIGGASTTGMYEDTIDSSEWYALGCALDGDNRIISDYILTGQTNLTIDSCLTTCEDKGFTYAGVEFGEECYCGNKLPTSLNYKDGGCTVVCTGNSGEMCGGEWTLDLYELVSGSTSCNSTPSATTSLQAGGAWAVPTGYSASSTSSSSSTTSTFATGTTVVSSTTDVSTGTTTSPSTGTGTGTSPTTVPSSSTTHQVWAHHMVGNTYPYTESSWSSDIQSASSSGIDGFALNMGSDSWQPSRVSDAYSAAESFGNFKMFLSLDMTSLPCSSTSDASNLVSLVKQFASSSAQATHEGKVLVSTFAGSDCTFGGGDWMTSFVQPLKSSGVEISFVPSLFVPISTFASETYMDGELNWNSAWPMGDVDLSVSNTDSEYMTALGEKEYMPAISPFFYTHFGSNSWNKNWLYRSDDWLYCERWEQVISLRDKVSMTELLTWNDYGESSYIGPIEGALPSGSEVWVDGFDHTALSSLTKYYSTAFKTGQYPDISQDEIILWSRPHPHDATATGDGVGRPEGWQNTEDYLYAVVFATEDGQASLTSGSQTTSFDVKRGLNKLKVVSNQGGIGGSLSRNGKKVVDYTAQGFTYTSNPQTYNYNYFVGSS